ncbi:tyrosine-type recombinase/integrase [Marispirochaeta sp.]|uniref:tyrosine-type recombinase/integrase n=1 Tax=Marispirochaeta sp. TaxID=2038653 RepID=UPI0029C80498|nr:tyrosine-type recombinase/integrase [Marispirochaeta sp.]
MSEGLQTNKVLQEYARDFYIWEKCGWIERQKAKGKQISEKWAQSRRSHLERYIFPEWSLRKLHRGGGGGGGGGPVEYEKWLIGLSLANGTKNGITYSLNIILKEAKREGLIRYNPLGEVEPLANNYRNRDAFDSKELAILFPRNEEKLISVWGERYAATLFTLMVTSGMRVGETIALQWKHILLNERAVLIKQAVKNDNSIGTTKSREQRGVIVPGVTLRLLKTWKEETLCPAEEDFIFHGLGKE